MTYPSDMPTSHPFTFAEEEDATLELCMNELSEYLLSVNIFSVRKNDDALIIAIKIM